MKINNRALTLCLLSKGISYVVAATLRKGSMHPDVFKGAKEYLPRNGDTKRYYNADYTSSMDNFIAVFEDIDSNYDMDDIDDASNEGMMKGFEAMEGMEGFRDIKYINDMEIDNMDKVIEDDFIYENLVDITNSKGAEIDDDIDVGSYDYYLDDVDIEIIHEDYEDGYNDDKEGYFNLMKVYNDDQEELNGFKYLDDYKETDSIFLTPIWPEDFAWSLGGNLPGYSCIDILNGCEPDSHTWFDNKFCWKKGKRDPGIIWSERRPIDNMRCTLVNEPSDPHCWDDNYLCVPEKSPLHFKWSHRWPIPNSYCMQWVENSDPHYWHDNYLCGEKNEAPLSSPYWKSVIVPPTSNGGNFNHFHFFGLGEKNISNINKISQVRVFVINYKCCGKAISLATTYSLKDGSTLI